MTFWGFCLQLWTSPSSQSSPRSFRTNSGKGSWGVVGLNMEAHVLHLRHLLRACANLLITHLSSCTSATLTLSHSTALFHWNWPLLFGLLITPRYSGPRMCTKPVPCEQQGFVTTDYTRYGLDYCNTQSQHPLCLLFIHVQTNSYNPLHICKINTALCTSILTGTWTGTSYSHSHQYHVNKLKIMGNQHTNFTT